MAEPGSETWTWSPSPGAAGWVARWLPNKPHQSALQGCESIAGLHEVQFLLNENLLIPFPLRAGPVPKVSIATGVIMGQRSPLRCVFTRVNGDTPCLC